MSCRLLGYQGPHYYSIAAVTEFVHTASLLHDDVVDHSTIRRGKPTANSIYGDESSVLVGDLVYSTASEMMAATGDMEIVKTFAEAIRLMSDGELLQLESLFKADLPEETYLRILECKTAILIAAACKSAALLAKAPTPVKEALAQFGYGVGMAFQLIDDALDYLGSEDQVGKSTLADLPEGKVTMPVLLLMKVANPTDVDVVRQTLALDPIPPEAAQKVSRLVARYDTANATIERAQHYTQLAMDALHSFPTSPERDALENLASKLLLRFH
jgi:octaprenyl-diphosphate synthase